MHIALFWRLILKGLDWIAWYLQEYYIRHMDGCTLDAEGEKERVIKCLEAAVQRRVSEVHSEKSVSMTPFPSVVVIMRSFPN